MHAPQQPDCQLRGLRFPRGPDSDDPGRYATGDRKIRNIRNDDGIGADDHVIADADAAENLGAGTEFHPIADPGCAERVDPAAFVPDCYAVTDQTVIADDGVAV